jgi:hypothetical protein
MNLKATLLARGTADLLFACYFFAMSLSGVPQSLHAAGGYLAVDGLLALCLAAAVHAHSRTRWLVGLALLDALARLWVSAIIFMYPRVEDWLLSTMFMRAALTAFCIAVGAAGMVYVLVARRASCSGYGIGTAWPAILLCLYTLAVGVGLALGWIGIDGDRTLIASNALVVGFTLLAAGISVAPNIRD